jgi:hypothetical protein
LLFVSLVTVVKQENTNTTSKKKEKQTRMKTCDTNASSSEKKEDGGDKAIVKADTSNTQIGVKENTHSESTTVTSETNNNRETLVNENDVTVQYRLPLKYSLFEFLSLEVRLVYLPPGLSFGHY